MQEKLEVYVERWQLKNPELIATTPTSHIYRVENNNAVCALKLLTEIGVADEWGGALALAYYDGHGAVKILQYDEGAHLLEFLDGDELIPLLEAGADDKATRLSAAVMNKLHENRGNAPAIRGLKSWFKSLFEKAQADEQAGIESIFRRAVPIAEALLATPREEVVLHADIHHANIRHHSKRGYLAFDPKGIYGERTYDAANMLYNPDEVVAVNEERLFRTAQILAKEMHLDYQRYLKFAYAYGCLSAAWSLEADDEISATVTIASMLEEQIER